MQRIRPARCLLITVVGAFFVTRANVTPFVPPAPPPEAGVGGLHQPVVQAALGLKQSVYGIGFTMARDGPTGTTG